MILFNSHILPLAICLSCLVISSHTSCRRPSQSLSAAAPARRSWPPSNRSTYPSMKVGTVKGTCQQTTSPPRPPPTPAKSYQSFFPSSINVYLSFPQSTVIHNVTSSASGVIEIPFVLKGQAPPAGDEPNRGTQNYSKPAVAIFTGAVYGDAEIEEMREACQGSSTVPWLRMDMSTPRPPLGPGYAEHVVERIKACMKRIEAEGKLREDGVWFY